MTIIFFSSFVLNNRSIEAGTFSKSDCQRISVVFEHCSYIVCLSNKKIYIVKRSNSQSRATNQRQRPSTPPSILYQPENPITSSEPTA